EFFRNPKRAPRPGGGIPTPLGGERRSAELGCEGRGRQDRLPLLLPVGRAVTGPPLGAHLSIAGGVVNAVTEAVRLGCQTFQLFTKNSNQWAGRAFAADEPALFRKALRKARLRYATAHDSYLINLATNQPLLWRN